VNAPARLPIAVNTFVWHSPLTDAKLSDLVPRIAGWGFEGIELPLELPGDWNAYRARDLLAEHGLQSAVCAVFPPGRELTAASKDVVETTLEYVRQCVDVAAVQGSRAVIGPMYTSVGRTWRMSSDERRQAIDDLRVSLRSVADYAGEQGIVIGIEPLNRYETSLLNTVEQTLDVIQDLPAEAIGLALDTYHQNIEEKNVPDSFRLAGDRLLHLQVCGNDRGSPGDDHLDWPGIRGALAEIGFTGMLGIESFTADNETIATAASIWRPLAPSQDQLATDGLAFLRTWREGWPR
jgi:D-psicose/D-tagatose/L-ribulose 3-epimerase